MDLFKYFIEFLTDPIDIIIGMSGDLYFFIEIVYMQRVEESE